MKKYRFSPLRTLSHRLIMMFLCALIPLQIFGIVLFSSGYKTISDQIKNISFSTMTSLGVSVQQEMEIIFSNLHGIKDNAVLRQITYPRSRISNADYYTELKNIQNSLRSILNNNFWISEIRLYITQSHSCLSVVQKNDTINGGKYDHAIYGEEEMNALLANIHGAGINVLLWDDTGFFVAVPYPENSFVAGKQPYFLVQIRLNTDEIRSALAARSSGEHESTAMFDLKSGIVITGTGSRLNEAAFSALYASIKDQPFPYSGSFFYEGVDYFVTVCEQEKFGLLFMQMVPKTIALYSLRHYEQGLFGFVLVSLIAFVLCSALSMRTVRNPILKLVGGFEEIEDGNYDIQLPLTKRADELAYLTIGFNHMAAKLNETINRLYKQEIYTQRMEMNQLQMQINPHFLFNSYFMMDRLLQQGDYEVAAELSNCLGEYFRYINRDARRYVELPLEWNHMCSYAKVQQLRYRRRLELIIEPVPEMYKNYIVPRLILQPLVENAVEHGLAHTQEGGIVQLSFDYSAQHLRIIVEDNGHEATDELIYGLKKRLSRKETANQEISALINIHRRLQLYYGEQYGIEISRSSLNGLRTEILLPGIERGDHIADTERADRG